MRVEVDVLVVNLNCLAHTKKLIKMLKLQTFKKFHITLIDQNSSENGTKEFLNEEEANGTTVIRNKANIPLNFLWNEFYKKSDCDILSYLNNDILIPNNFLDDTVNIFKNETDVGIVIHATNNLKYQKNDSLQYIKIDNGIRQGWDFSIRRKNYVKIPDSLDFYCGDDFLFEHIYRQNQKVAICLSSPIIHLLSQTKKNNRIILNRNPIKDVIQYKLLGYKHNLDIPKEYSNLNPPEKLYVWCDVA